MNKWETAARACLDNGELLLEDADWHCIARHSGSAFALSVIAQEEFAKAFLFQLIGQGMLPAIPILLRMARDHTCKQLLGLVMDHIHPEDDEYWRRMDEWHKMHTELMSLLRTLETTESNERRRQLWERIDELNRLRESVPPVVADALNILRWEKVGRWESRNWFWAEEPEYNELAQGVAEGTIDRQKQDGFYVRVAPDGSVLTTPSSVRLEIAKDAFERARRFGQLARRLLANDTGGLFDYDRIKEALDSLFASLKSDSEQIKPSTT